MQQLAEPSEVGSTPHPCWFVSVIPQTLLDPVSTITNGGHTGIESTFLTCTISKIEAKTAGKRIAPIYDATAPATIGAEEPGALTTNSGGSVGEAHILQMRKNQVFEH